MKSVCGAVCAAQNCVKNGALTEKGKTMRRYIDADALMDKTVHMAKVCYGEGQCYCTRTQFQKMIEEAPTVDAVPVVHGEWINVGERLPERSKNVLVANCRGKQWDIDKAWWNGMYFDRCGKKPFFHVTHWMPLPEPPNCGAKMETVTDCHTLEDGERC